MFDEVNSIIDEVEIRNCNTSLNKFVGWHIDGASIDKFI